MNRFLKKIKNKLKKHNSLMSFIGAIIIPSIAFVKEFSTEKATLTINVVNNLFIDQIIF